MASRLPVIVLEQLPPFQILETIDSETIIADRMTRLKALWTENDPPAGANYDVENLEFDPLKINQELNAFFETTVRDRINQAARGVTLAYAISGDLDAIATRYPFGVPRLPVVDDPRPYTTNPEDWEADDRYRRRILLSSSTLSAHGTYESYVFWAMSADATLHDATATAVPGSGKVLVTIMASGSNPEPTSAQLNAVQAYIDGESRRGLTDIVQVAGPRITHVTYEIEYDMFPGWDQPGAEAVMQTNLDELISKQHLLGYDHTRMSIMGAIASIGGVHNATIVKPANDVMVEMNGLVEVDDVILTFTGRAE